MNRTERKAAAQLARIAHEDGILEIADDLSPDDTSEAAEYLRDAAGSIRAEREAAEYRAAHGVTPLSLSPVFPGPHQGT